MNRHQNTFRFGFIMLISVVGTISHPLFVDQIFSYIS